MESRISDVAFCRSVGACNRPRSLILGPIVQNESSNQIDENGHGKSGQTRPFLDAQDEWKLGYRTVQYSTVLYCTVVEKHELKPVLIPASRGEDDMRHSITTNKLSRQMSCTEPQASIVKGVIKLSNISSCNVFKNKYI